MFERISKRVEDRMETLRKRVVARLAAVTPPPGIAVSVGDEDITLTGRKLRQRFIDDARIREWFR